MGEQSGGPGVGRPGFLFEIHGPPTSPGTPKHVAERKLLCTSTCYFLCNYAGGYIEKTLKENSGNEIISDPINDQVGIPSQERLSARLGCEAVAEFCHQSTRDPSIYVPENSAIRLTGEP